MSDVVLHEKKRAAFWITLNRPDKRNAIDRSVVDGVAEGYRLAHNDPDIRAIVITGAGDRAFCAGGDLQSGKGFSFDHGNPTMPYADLLRLAWNSNLPVIARVNGACVAGGMGLLAIADMAVASDTAQFGLPEVKVGVFPMQVLAVLQGLVHPRILREWCLTGEPFGADAALAAGLLNYVVPAESLDETTAWLVDRVTGKSPTAIRRGKYALRALASMSFEQSIAFAEGQLALLAETEDAKEGLAAFNEKRKPTWTGR
jgi:methylglutaconyl-CoA hydratase